MEFVFYPIYIRTSTIQMFSSFVKEAQRMLPAEPPKRKLKADIPEGKKNKKKKPKKEKLSQTIMLNIKKQDEELIEKRSKFNKKLQKTIKCYSSLFDNDFKRTIGIDLNQITQQGIQWKNYVSLPTKNNSYKYIDGVLYIVTSLKYKDWTTKPKIAQNNLALWIKSDNPRNQQPTFVWCCPDSGASDIPREKCLAVIIMREDIEIERGEETIKSTRYTLKHIYEMAGDRQVLRKPDGTKYSPERGSGYVLKRFKFKSGVNKDMVLRNIPLFQNKRVLIMKPLIRNVPKKTMTQEQLKVLTLCRTKMQSLINKWTDIYSREILLTKNREEVDNELEGRVLDITMNIRKNDLETCQSIMDKFEEDTTGLYWNQAVETPLKAKSFQTHNDYVDGSVVSYILAHEYSRPKKCTWRDHKNELHWYTPADWNDESMIPMGSVVAVIEKQDVIPVKHLLRGLYMALFLSTDKERNTILVLRRLNPKGGLFDSNLINQISETPVSRLDRMEKMKAIKNHYNEQKNIAEFDKMFGSTDDEK